MIFFIPTLEQIIVFSNYRAGIALKLGRLVSFIFRKAYLFLTKSASVGNNPDRERASFTISQYSFNFHHFVTAL